MYTGEKREVCRLVWQISTGPVGGQSSALGNSNVTEKMNFLGHREPSTQDSDHEGGGRECCDDKPKGAPTRHSQVQGHTLWKTPTVPSAYENQPIINTLYCSQCNLWGQAL